MKKIFLAILLIVLAIFSPASAGGQCLMAPLSLQLRVQQSAVIVEGIVTGKSGFISPFDNLIYTTYTIHVSKLLKGNLTGNYISMIEKGGTVGNKTLQATPALDLAPGQQGIFMFVSLQHHLTQVLINSPYPCFEAYGLAQGFIKYDVPANIARDPFNSYKMSALRDSIIRLTGQTPFSTNSIPAFPNEKQLTSVPQISGFFPDSLSAGTLSVLSIHGSGFGIARGTGTVSFNYMNDNGESIEALSNEYFSWSDTLIQVFIPTGAGTGAIKVTQAGNTATSAAILTVPYTMVTYIDSSIAREYPIYLVNANGQGGYDFYMNDSMFANAPAAAAFLRALNTWRCNTKVDWNYIGTSSATSSTPSANLVYFDTNDPLPAGVLGQLLWNFEYCGSGTNLQSYLSYFDLVIRADIGWCYGPENPTPDQYDIETVFLHELGHAHMLGHAVSTGDFMHSSTAPGVQIRDLSIGNLAGGNYEMSNSASIKPCGHAGITYYSQACNTTAINEIEEAELSIFPNPFVNLITVKGTETNAVISVYDVSGNKLQEVRAIGNVTIIPSGQLLPGLYLVRYSSQKKEATFKLIKN